MIWEEYDKIRICIQKTRNGEGEFMVKASVLKLEHSKYSFNQPLDIIYIYIYIYINSPLHLLNIIGDMRT
jgi:hypothetical protein